MTDGSNDGSEPWREARQLDSSGFVSFLTWAGESWKLKICDGTLGLIACVSLGAALLLRVLVVGVVAARERPEGEVFLLESKGAGC